jgi:hypothetical protein
MKRHWPEIVAGTIGMLFVFGTIFLASCAPKTGDETTDCSQYSDQISCQKDDQCDWATAGGECLSKP